MSPLTPTSSFKNEVSRRFHSFFKHKLDEGEISPTELAAAFGRSISNPSQFLGKMKSGDSSVTIDDIETARDKFQLSPAFLFGEQQQDTISHYVAEHQEAYLVMKGSRNVGKLLKDILKKHKTEIKSYSEEKLKMSESHLHKIFRNEVRPYFDTVLRICEDHGESLDQFMEKPLPRGHLLQQLKLMEQLLEEKDNRIALLEKQSAGKK